MNDITKIYRVLLKQYGQQGWWPIINPKTLMCEYHKNAPNNDLEKFQIMVGCILTQNTQWYPNTVRALQQLMLGRPFTKEELVLIRYAEHIHHKTFASAGVKVDRVILNKEEENIALKQLLRILKCQKSSLSSEVLTQNTAWPNVEKALVNLKRLGAIDPKKIVVLDEEILKEAIKPAGYYNQKSKKLIIFSKFYLDLGNKVPTRDELLFLWGVGPETADSMLLYAFKVPSFVVDSYTKRIFKNLGLIDDSMDYGSIKELFEKSLPKDYKLYQEYHALIVEHAKRYYIKKGESEKCNLKKLM